MCVCVRVCVTCRVTKVSVCVCVCACVCARSHARVRPRACVCACVRACVCLYLCVWYIYLSVSLLCLSTLHIWVSGVMNDHCSHSHAHIPCTSRWEVCRQKRESSPAVSRERITLEHRSGIALENTDRLLVPATRHFTTLGPHNKSCRQIPGCEWLQAWNAS